MDANPATIQYPIQGSISSAPVAQKQAAKPATEGWSGRVIGEYEIQHLLGQGGNGQVYLAKHRWLDLPVAIKVLQHVNTNDKQVLDRFQREAQIAARMRHPHLVRCTDGGVIGENLFLVTDHVDGDDLRSLVRRCGPLGVADACEIIRQTAIALQFIVDSNTIHRDIKPANIMLDRDGVIRVLDMGLARCTINQETLTETGQVMGTLDYMAPEQAVDSRDVDFRADIYSLGCTFYFLLTGLAPFSSDDNSTIAAKILAHLEAEHPPIKSFRRDVPRNVVALIDQMLDKSPELRPASFESVHQLLQPFSEANGVATLVANSGADVANPQPRAAQSGPKLSDRIEEGLAATLTMLFRFMLIVLGFLDRTPPSRPGQKPVYHFSFRWLKGLLALSSLWFAFWFTGIRFGPVENVPSNEGVGSSDAVTLNKHTQTSLPAEIKSHQVPPHPMHLPHHRPPHAVGKRPGPGTPPPSRSNGVQFNQFN